MEGYGREVTGGFRSSPPRRLLRRGERPGRIHDAAAHHREERLDAADTYSPWIPGQVLNKNDRTVIDVRITIHPVAVVVVLAFVLGAEYLAIAKESALNLPFLGIFIIFHVISYYVGFLPEAKKAEQWLRSNLR